MNKSSRENKPEIKQVLITSLTPYFLEREFVWFERHLKEILRARKHQAFWQDNTLFLEKDQEISLSEVLRKLDELGYEKVFKTSEPGEFSQAGGLIEVFPVNFQFAVRLDFLGNKIDSIEKLALTVNNENQSKKILKKKLKGQKLFSDLKNLKPGDYLVHLDHGIGRFLKIGNFQFSIFPEPEPSVRYGAGNFQPISNDSIFKQKKQDRKYYLLEYATGDRLYVPLGLERKLSRYIGFREPKLSRLGSSLWHRTKQKIKEEAEKLARELLKTFAQKELAQRPAYQDKAISQGLAETFPYQLTPDQEKALDDLNSDLNKTKPMNRLICGDVGFGKTELALRASVRTAENNKQTALIAPTTILAKQHFDTFQGRLKNLPFNLALLSRLTPQKEKKKIIQDLGSGRLDIVLGTHALLSSKIKFKDLGLLIIDDEQKFGVRQKEKLRAFKPEIDVLSLSATPIPRTLYLALSSLQDISLIQTPPLGRKAIKTFVLPFKKEVIKKAIEKELERDGQIYFLHNRVETIEAFKKFLQGLGTKAKIGILHAKLPENQIIKKLEDFKNGKDNLLLATTIIENGLDLPNVNTLIIDNSLKLGLSQAYQLRGRVGRADKQAFAWFLYPKKGLRNLAKKRLKALRKAEELGSCYQVALADLEIRGAGNILGKEQSGAVNQVGLNLYCQMLSEAIERLKSG